MPHPSEHSPASRPLAPTRRRSSPRRCGRSARRAGCACSSRWSTASGPSRISRARRAGDERDVAPAAHPAVAAPGAGATPGRHAFYALHDHHVADLLAAVRHHREHAPEPPTPSDASAHGRPQHARTATAIRTAWCTTRSSARARASAPSCSRCSSSASRRWRRSRCSSRRAASRCSPTSSTTPAMPRPRSRSASPSRCARPARSASPGCSSSLAIFVSACVAGFEAIHRLIDPRDVEHLGALAAAGALGFAGNWLAAIVRTRAGGGSTAPRSSPTATTPAPTPTCRSRSSPRAAVVALGLQLADPLIGLAITVVILRITWSSWKTVRGHRHPVPVG